MTGAMRRSGHVYMQNHEAHIKFDFPAGQHEQDPDMPFDPPGHKLPPRPFMVPALVELYPDLVDLVESSVALRL
jgi:hypothetical protein